MKLSFTKMNGAGNDFVMLDNRSRSLSLTPKQIEFLCDRHRGIGGDGLLLVEPPTSAQSAFRMRYYNSDGSEADMCGNGARCFSRFAQKVGGGGKQFAFETNAGLIRTEIDGRQVRINLSQPHSLRLKERVALASGETEIHSINTGVPHAVLLTPDAGAVDVQNLGHEIRFHRHFAPKGTNVNFVEKVDNKTIRVRTYERGVEAETLACGTGVTASALISHLLLQIPSPVQVRVKGGDTLEISFSRQGEQFTDVFLKGPADFVFEGQIELEDSIG
ncbi:MAG: diaminopimelate epimerase [Verrucomicrobiae bacterium]|nr:diaminopimelate epimerase [Verrucomicrobiae bacterium]